MTSREINLNSDECAKVFFGNLDENVKIIEKEMGIEIVGRGTQISFSGDEKAVETAVEAALAMLTFIKANGSLEEQTVRYCLTMAAEGETESLKNLDGDCIFVTTKGKPIKPKTLGQKHYLDAINKNFIVFGVGPAGTGKTYLAVVMAVRALKNHEVTRIILTRPAVEAGEKLGFLPGDLQTKIDPYLRPLYDALFDTLGPESFQKLVEKGIIEVAPLAY
ncbi:MAG: PhoH family protein, partial [Oscillospiraceae bacterium]